MTSKYLDRPRRTEREAELERALRGLINAVRLSQTRGSPATMNHALKLKRAEEVLKGVEDD